MDRSLSRRFITPLFRSFGIALLVGVSLFAGPMAPAESAEKATRMTPEQRRQMWNQMSPQQREQWRNARGGAEQHPDVRGQISPEERRAMRQRFYDRQQGSQVPGPQQDAHPRRQLTPEERQQLRQQIEQAQRNIYRRPDGGNKGSNK